MKNPFPVSVYKKRSHDRKEDIRGEFFRDQTAIIHSQAFRRLKHKTQVFFAPENDHVCTRIEHVMHVATIAKTICKGLNAHHWDLDVEMAFAIGLGHDLGHAPFGHEGEYVLNDLMGGENAFLHEINSYRVIEHLANYGKGLNLTYGVKDGIICHNGEKFEQYLKPVEQLNDLEKIKDRNCVPASYEGCIVRFADKIAYLGRDIEDAILARFIKIEDIPENIRKAIGQSNREIINSLVYDIVENSKNKDYIGLSDQKYQLIRALARFNYDNIYLNDEKMNYRPYAKKIIHSLFEYLLELWANNKRDYHAYQNSKLRFERDFGDYLEKMHDFYLIEKNPKQIAVDYVSGMTDSYALDCIRQITFPAPIFGKRC